MGKKNQQKQQQSAVAEPWSPAQRLLGTAIDGAYDAHYNDTLVPEAFGSRLAGESQNTLAARANMAATAGNNPATGVAMNAYTDMVGGDPYARLDQVQEAALRGAMPSAASYLQGAGMLNSSVGAEHLAETAARAVAPFQYDAFNQDQNRRLQAMSMAPQFQDLAYADDRMLASVGGAEDLRAQQVVDDQAALHYEEQDRNYQSLMRALGIGATAGGLGGTQNGIATTTQKPGIMGMIGGAMSAGSQFIPLLKG